MVNVKNNLVGKHFNRLVVIGLDTNRTEEKRKAYWLCKCDCGNTKSVRGDSLIDGSIKSCGCLKREQDKINLIACTHGLRYTRQFNIWCHMKARCYNTSSPKYRVYGGRGIKICDDWKNDFLNFYNWSIANGYSDELSIERINVNGNYEPSNCRWATLVEQAQNKQNTLYLTIDGTTMRLKEWCEIYNINYKKAHSRLKKYGEDAIDKIFYQGNLGEIHKQQTKIN